ncbi:hypothetical protein N0V86_005622 [Didymella sp. IMI 355093]|nr:hypothetical protein N0V86_005622 [Didymella sp. IMI 355093]
MEAPADVVQSVETPPAVQHDDAIPKAALTPPTSEDNDPKREERMSSELSDIDSDDGEDIEPDHYWDGGKIPVFKPTMAQFHNFKRFIEKVDKFGMKSGIVKVIPPAEWRDSLPDLQEAVKSIRVKNPITQEFTGQHGVYTGANVEKQRSYNLPEWRAVTDEPHHQPPAKRGETRAGRKAEPPARTRSTRAAPKTDDGTPAPKRKPGRPARGRRNIKKEEVEDEDDDEADNLDVPPTPTSPGAEDAKPAKRGVRAKKEGTPTRPRGRQPRAQNEKKSVSSRRLNNRGAVNDYIDEAAFEDFNYHLEGLEEFTPERCKELEETYWKTIWSGQPMYGADMPGSLFDDRTTSWNVAKLPNLLDVLGTKVPGVNTAYLYLGMWKASFAWHLEDVDLYSINYIHFGAPKQWYSISQEDARRFEAAMKSIWPNDAKNCSQFLRHKTYLISPQRLEKDFNIKVNRLVHYEGEFVITYPYGYHSGYNIGYNCAESVNFATESWLSYGRIAKKCDCESDSVWVDVNEIERKLRGEPTPEYYEETDDEEDEEDGADRLPSPPASVAGGKTKKKPGRKPAAKRKRGKDEPQEAVRPKKLRKIRIRLKIPGRGMPCILCPNDVDYDDLLPTDNGMKAHRICADYTPETYIQNETVCNVANIGKDRLELKCNYCRSKRGAVFQCSQKKCTRAFHATCAVAAGVQVDLGQMQTFDAEGTEYYYDGYDFRCRFHRPKKRNNKTVDVDALEKNKWVLNYGKTLKPKDVIQFQYVGGEMYQIYGAQVVENRPGEQSVLVDVLPDGDRVEVEWKYILKLHPDESQRPKPSKDAQPLPEHLKENDASLDITNRTDGVPEMGDPFHDPNSEQKWAEWNTAPEVTRAVKKVDFSKENRLWYYLGKPSTEAKPQYTEDPAKPRNNPKSNFLDTVKPPPPPIPIFQRQSYPASYPIQPAPSGMARPSYQQQIAPAGGRPYTYKPKDVMITTWKSPTYNPDTRQNPNSPVAHQPNVTYDYRAGPQYHYPPPPRPLAQQQQYQPYVPPPHNYSAQGYASKAASGPLLDGIDKYAHTNQSHQALPPYPYQTPSNAQVPRQLPPYPGSSTAPHGSSAQYGQTPPSHGRASISNMLSTPTGTPKSPMYAVTSSSSVVYAAQTPTEYLAYVMKYPYLKNAYLRRQKTYISPYSPGGGIAPEWMPKPPQVASGATPTPMSNESPGSHSYYPSPSPGSATQRPSAQFQSPDAFQRGLTQASSSSTGAPKWEQMLKQLATSTGPAATPSVTTSQTPQYPPLPRSSTSYGMPNAPGPFQKHSPPLPQSVEPQRPIPSPISDDGKSGVVAAKPVLPPPAAMQPAPGQVHSAETWRFS